MIRPQDALYVYYIGYGIKEMPPPALVPITLQPKHGSAVTVQSESYRPAGAQAQIILFSSNRLDPMETYTITVTKSNATLGNGVNIDAFLLTKPDGANSTSSPGTNALEYASELASDPPLAAETTTSAQPSSVANSPNGGMIAGVVVAIVIGILVACLILRWWLKRNRQKPVPVGPDGLPITNETSRPAYFSAAPPYSSKGTSSSPQNTNPAVADHHLYTQRRVDTPPSLAPTRAPGQMSGHNEMIQVQQTLSYTPLAQGKARYMGNNPPSHLAPTPTSSSYAVPSSPEDTENRGAMLPAYSPHQV